MLTYILLAIIILFFLKIIVFADKKPELLLLIPFIISTNFFGFLPYSFFSTEGVVQQDDIVLIVIVLIFLYFYFNYKPIIYENDFLKVYKKIIFVFIAFIIFNLLLSVILYGNFISSFKVFRIFFRYASIPLFINIILRIEKKGIYNLLKYIDVVTVVLAIMYILNYGFGLTIFVVRSYQEDVYYGTLVYRNFFAFPIFIFLVLSRMLLSDKLNMYRLIVVAILLINVLLVYTRTLLVVAFVIIIASLIIRSLIFNVHFNITKIAVSTIVLIFFGVVLTNVIFSKQYEYFKSRIDEVMLVGSIYEVNNFELRADIISSRIEKTFRVNPVFGLGFIREDVSSKYYPDLFIRRGDKTGTILVGDQSWGGFIASLGFGGTILFLLLFFYPVFYLYKSKLNKKLDNTFWAVVLTLFCEIFIIGFISTNLIDEIFKLSFYLALFAFYCSSEDLNTKVNKRSYSLN